jgi:hypothetical protein
LGNSTNSTLLSSIVTALRTRRTTDGISATARAVVLANIGKKNTFLPSKQEMPSQNNFPTKLPQSSKTQTFLRFGGGKTPGAERHFLLRGFRVFFPMN